MGEKRYMATNKITISEIIALKGGTIEELCLYAQSKGIILPNAPEYVLTPSQLISIDPQLAFNMRYGKFISENKEKQSDSSKEKQTLVLPEVYHLPNDNLRVPQLNVLGKIDLSTLNQSSEPESKVKDDNGKSAEKKKKLKELLESSSSLIRPKDGDSSCLEIKALVGNQRMKVNYLAFILQAQNGKALHTLEIMNGLFLRRVKMREDGVL